MLTEDMTYEEVMIAIDLMEPHEIKELLIALLTEAWKEHSGNDQYN